MGIFASKCAVRHQSGAALATALLFLIVLTLLSLVAMRSGRVDLRLALNDESRMAAAQSAQSILESVLADARYLEVRPGSDYVQSCYVASDLDIESLESEYGFECPNNGPDLIDLPDSILADHAYTSVHRDAVGGLDFAPMSALREGDSGLRYQLAGFTVTAGFDRSQGALGGAEVAQGVYVKLDTRAGLTVR
ncbi:MAG: hypothetical protein K0U79_03395 [Gammaproteobacteria bacterium]|nr:hypothetical protein [Gammaproteobacteria bacterium]